MDKEILEELGKLQKGINVIKQKIEGQEKQTPDFGSGKEFFTIKKDFDDPLDDFSEDKLHDTDSIDLKSSYDIIKEIIDNSDIEDLFSGVKYDKNKSGVEVIDRGKVISDKFCVYVETLYSAKYERDGDKTSIMIPINTNIKKVEDIEYIDTDSKFIIKHIPSGESLDLFINVMRTRKGEDDIFVFNTDENCLSEKPFLRTIFRKSEYWESKPFIEYNSDGTVKSQNFNKGDLKLEYINEKGESIQIPFENITFI